ncbi:MULTISPECIES: succinate dehydrogenase, cytochrome b556 subunit [Candidatus Ichthyocystis]|uniref:Succinate dehydrogenase cytochrome b556 subunit n=1 Tax=Candidatus Ichthyocystis hellenicum TaxID=1561003 RepID=A0A0S4M2T6_9BURK|nr:MULTISPECIES: succinate dehydrogenase, cytochrome b556 subunit [Ichthyocystis]CUT18085.1 Succinate dehydrogenase/fumarate reductase, cytochrome b subunit [Candidatus Ichthyocystis hellenicum]
MSSSPSSKKQFRNIQILDISKYRLPIPGIVSILHRISGVFLFLAIPAVLFILEKTLRSPLSFASVTSYLRDPIFKILLVIVFWSFIHHILAGVRFLALDLHWGVTKYVSRLTSSIVFGTAVILTIMFSVWMFL